MATVFDASEIKRQKKQAELREELAEMSHEKKHGKRVAQTASQPEEQPVRHKRHATEYSQVLREAKHNGSWWSAFVTQPDAHFEAQHSDEEILLVLRQHPIVNIKWILSALIMFLAPYLLFPIFPIADILPTQYNFFFMVGWYLLIFTVMIEGFLGWYFNIYLITDERIIDIDFISLIYRKVSEAKIEKIEDVTATTAGVMGAILNYGDISLQTAAEQREFEFLKVPQPTKVTQFLNELILEEEREKIEGRTH